MSDRTFADKHILVTGGGSGIGRAAALAFAEQGAASVTVTGRRREPLEEVGTSHPVVVPVVADVTAEAGAAAVAESITERGGVLDVIVHNAGVFRRTPLADLDLAAVRELLRVNVFGPVLLTAKLLPSLRSPGGAVVVVSSINGRVAAAGTSVYSATKAAADSLIANWAIELAPKGIRVNGVAPGTVPTRILAAGGVTENDADEWRDDYARTAPAGRIGRVEDVVPWITRLAEPASSWVTGEVIVVDGGKTLVGF
ncbi:SDR family NAD(P)-dependent oxidoreductase [Nocardia wallacei]|uniref:SDR family NAD(P)-dependent oxidoreductase n=1 Tax=Nocardia wallacei TaxID=480035 RepID=UPI002455EE36|nr:SDR family oxidoreductase [Nocardia wallacei]